MVRFIKHLFLPLQSNNFRPRILEWDYFGFLALFIIGIKILSLVSFEQFLTGDIYNSISQSDLYTLTNQVRQENKVATLTPSPKLELAAQMKLVDMFQNNYFAHVSPSGITPWNWIGKAKYDYTVAGENLAMNFFNSDETMKAWLNSEFHKRNILLPEFKDIGIAVDSGVINGQSTTVVVQVFGQPKIERAVVRPISRTTPKATPRPVAQVTAKSTLPTTSPGIPVAQVKSEASIGETNTGVKAYSYNLFLEKFMILVFAITLGIMTLKIFVNINVQVPELIVRALILVLISGVFVNLHDAEISRYLHSNIVIK